MSDASILRHYLAPLEPLLHAEDVTELVINRAGEVGVEGAKGWTWFERPELTSSWLTTLASLQRPSPVRTSAPANRFARPSCLAAKGAKSLCRRPQKATVSR